MGWTATLLILVATVLTLSFAGIGIRAGRADTLAAHPSAEQAASDEQSFDARLKRSQTLVWLSILPLLIVSLLLVLTAVGTFPRATWWIVGAGYLIVIAGMTLGYHGYVNRRWSRPQEAPPA